MAETFDQPLFADNREGDSDLFRRCRDDDFENPRGALERAWKLYGCFLGDPEHFRVEIRRDFMARAWELALLSLIGDAGFALERAPTKGPDIRFRLNDGRTCWIEAVVPRPGDGEDKVFQRPPGGWVGSLYPINALLLRYLSVLNDKLAKITAYREAGIVAMKDVTLIAVGAGGILDADMHDTELPAIIKALWPVGEVAIRITPYSDKPAEPVWRTREAVTKRNDHTVKTTLFLEERSAPVSGVLFSRLDVWNIAWEARRDLFLAHNGVAQVPLGIGQFPVKCELWLNDEGRIAHRGKCARFGPYSAEGTA